MCMITFVPANVEIPEEGIRNGTVTNDDGHGWAVASARFGLQVGKSMDAKQALADFIKAREEHGPDSLGLFHSRFATHGTKNEYNVHPFWAGENTVVAHNGILPGYWHPKAGDNRSDTRIFAEQTLPLYLTDKGIPSRRGGKEIAKMITSANKLVILSVADGTPRVRIVNANSGIHEGGVWYSNSGYKPYTSHWSYGSYGDYGDWSGYGYGRGYVYENGKRVYKGGTVSSCTTQKKEGEPRMITAGSDDKDQILKDIADALNAEEITETSFKYEGEWYSVEQCETCLATGYILLDSNTCERCGTCQDCWENVENCDCLGGSESRQISSETSMFNEVQAVLGAEFAEEEEHKNQWSNYQPPVAPAWSQD